MLLDGHDIRQLQLHWYRHQLGLVSQEPVLFRYESHVLGIRPCAQLLEPTALWVLLRGTSQPLHLPGC